MQKIKAAAAACAVLALALCLAPGRSGVGAAKPALAVGCGGGANRLITIASPTLPGPLRLTTVYCIDLPHSLDPPALSPDGTHYFERANDGLWVGSPGSSAKPRYLEVPTVGAFGYSDTIPFAWSGDSNAILGARQNTLKPSGHALGPLSPLAISLNGSPHPLPILRNPAGGLDGLLWVGGDGLALAEFGTKGSSYRPEHHDPRPTLAMVDARRGKILQTADMPLQDRSFPPQRTGGIDARLDAAGKIHAIFLFKGRQWYEWQQGQKPHPLALDTGHMGGAPFAMTPDLKGLLIMRGLSATGMMCEYGASCPPPVPATGTIAELRDIATGRFLWKITGTATTFSNSCKPTISPDGRYAWISMPPDAGRRETTALISMRDGHILQRINELHACGTGFGRDNKTAWLSVGSLLATYRLESSGVHP